MTPKSEGNVPLRYARLHDELKDWQRPRLQAQFISRYDTPLLQLLLQKPDGPFKDIDATIIKDDAKTSLALTSFDGRQFVIKRYNIKNLFHRVRLIFKPARAKNNFFFARRLGSVGINAVRPVAWVQEIRLGLRARSWFIYEHVDDATCADTLTDASDPTVVDRVIQTVTENLSKMREHLLSHGDMKPSNILVTSDEVVLLDLDAMRQHRSLLKCEKALGKDVARWMRWWRTDRPQPRICDKAQTLLIQAGFQVPNERSLTR